MISRHVLGRSLDEIEHHLAPVSASDERLVPVPAPLAPLFPAGGVRQGWSIGVDGDGGWSLAMALAGAALPVDGWLAGVGLEELGLSAGEELGVRLDRVLMVETPPVDRWATVMAALFEAVDVICVGPRIVFDGPSARRSRDARRLSARAREQGCVLFHLDGGRGWPQGLDVRLTARSLGWSGIGEGHGHLRSRRLVVEAMGRRSMAKPRSIEVICPGPNGALEAVEGASAGPGRGEVVDVRTSHGRGVVPRLAGGVVGGAAG